MKKKINDKKQHYLASYMNFSLKIICAHILLIGTTHMHPRKAQMHAERCRHMRPKDKIR